MPTLFRRRRGTGLVCTMKSLRSVNLNLLPILRELLRKRSVSQAARTLNMSQSAASEALGRLRELFDDPLLIRHGPHYRLSSLAERIRPVLDEALVPIEQLVCDAAFDPTRLHCTLKIATVDYLILVLGQKIIGLLAERAPGVTLHFTDFTNDSYQALSQGHLDFVISLPHNDALLQGQVIAEHESVCLVGRSSQVGETISEAQFWESRHIAFSPGDDPSQSLHVEVLRGQGRAEFNAVIVQSFMLLPFLVGAAPNSLAIVARPLAEALASTTETRIARLPFDFPKVPVTLHWERAKTHDPLLAWFRDLVREALCAPTLAQ